MGEESLAPTPTFPVLPPLDVILAPGGGVYQVYPYQEQHHDIADPHRCNCFPTYECLLDEEGMAGLVIVQHHWLQ